MAYAPAVCARADEALAAEIPEDALRIYDEVAAGFVARIEAGEAIADAWDASVSDYAASTGQSFIQVLEITNPIGKANNQAIEACQ